MSVLFTSDSHNLYKIHCTVFWLQHLIKMMKLTDVSEKLAATFFRVKEKPASSSITSVTLSTLVWCYTQKTLWWTWTSVNNSCLNPCKNSLVNCCQPYIQLPLAVCNCLHSMSTAIPYLKAIPSTQNPRICHAMMKENTINMVMSLLLL